MHIADVKIPSSWTSLADLITTVDPASEYLLINSSPDLMYAVEGDTTPADDVIGVPVLPNNYIQYKKGSQANLYIRNAFTPVISGGVDTQNKLSNLTINKVG